MKICKNCEFYKGNKTEENGLTWILGYEECTHPSLSDTDLVTGEPIHQACRFLRYEGACSQEGIYFRKRGGVKVIR